MNIPSTVASFVVIAAVLGSATASAQPLPLDPATASAAPVASVSSQSAPGVAAAAPAAAPAPAPAPAVDDVVDDGADFPPGLVAALGGALGAGAGLAMWVTSTTLAFAVLPDGAGAGYVFLASSLFVPVMAGASAAAGRDFDEHSLGAGLSSGLGALVGGVGGALIGGAVMMPWADDQASYVAYAVPFFTGVLGGVAGTISGAAVGPLVHGAIVDAE